MDPDLGFLPGPASGMYINMVHKALREGKRASRYALLQSDAILEVFRRHKSELRMQLLAGSAAQRARLLRGALMVCTSFCWPQYTPSAAYVRSLESSITILKDKRVT